MSDVQEEVSGRKAQIGCLLGCLGVLVVTGGAYWGTLWLLGLNGEQAADVTVQFRLAGFAAALVVMAMIGVMGETLIEDLVKAAMIDALAITAWFQVGDRVRTVLVGILVGTTLMVVVRFITRRRVQE
jgi:hypothetical protein